METKRLGRPPGSVEHRMEGSGAGRRGDMVIAIHLVCPCPLSPCLATSYADAPMVVYRRQTLQQMFVVPLRRQALCQALGQKQR